MKVVDHDGRYIPFDRGKIVVRNERYKSVRAVKGGFKYCEFTITIFFYGF